MGFFNKIGRFFGGHSGGNPAESAMPYLNQIPGIGREYYDPFIQQGRQAQQQLNPMYERMSQDPTEFINALMRGYSPSEGYRFKEGQMMKAAQNAAASGGFAGTDYDQMQRADMIRGLMGEDQQQFLANILGIQGAGMQGLEGQVGRGYESAGNLAGYLGNALGAQGGAAFQGQAQRNANRMGRSNAFYNLLGNLAGAGAGIYGANKLYNQNKVTPGG